MPKPIPKTKYPAITAGNIGHVTPKSENSSGSPRKTINTRAVTAGKIP